HGQGHGAAEGTRGRPRRHGRAVATGEGQTRRVTRSAARSAARSLRLPLRLRRGIEGDGTSRVSHPPPLRGDPLRSEGGEVPYAFPESRTISNRRSCTRGWW